jgi:alpha-N-arabinofuranosidase
MSNKPGSISLKIITVDRLLLARFAALRQQRFHDVPYLESTAVHDEENDRLTIFAVNRDLQDSLLLTCDIRGFEGYVIEEHIVLEHEDLKARNTEELPDNVQPHSRGKSETVGDQLTAHLPKQSWNVIRLVKVKR